MIKGEVVGGSRVAANLNALPQEIRSGLHQGIGRACLMVLTRTKEQKLSGQVLNVRTGRLRRSITQRIEDNQADVTGIVGTNVEYAGVHEYGFHGVVSVREHLRKTKSGRQALVRSHSRNMNVQERSFLRSSLHELSPEIREAISLSIAEKLRARA